MSEADKATDEELVKRIRAGDDAAYETLCARHSGRLLARIGTRVSGALRRKVGASDVLQEAYLVAFRRLAEFEDRGDGSFGRWLAQIVDWKVREAVKRYARLKRRAEVSSDPRIHAAEAAGPSASQVAMAEELRAKARTALERLPEAHREVLRLIQDEQLSVDDAAVRMGRTREAVRKLYSRALARFAELVNPGENLGRQGSGR